MRRYVWSRNLKTEDAMGHVGPQRRKTKEYHQLRTNESWKYVVRSNILSERTLNQNLLVIHTCSLLAISCDIFLHIMKEFCVYSDNVAQ